MLKGNKIRVGKHEVTEAEMFRRIVDKIPSEQFHNIIKSIEKDLDKGE